MFNNNYLIKKMHLFFHGIFYLLRAPEFLKLGPPFPYRFSPEGPCPGPHVGGGGERESLPKQPTPFQQSLNHNQQINQP